MVNRQRKKEVKANRKCNDTENCKKERDETLLCENELQTGNDAINCTVR